MEDRENQPNLDQKGLPKTSGSFWDIFLEPSKAFEAINRKPVFVIPLVLCILASFATSFVMYSRIDMAQAMRTQIESSPAAGQLTEEQISEQVEMAVKIGRISALVAPLIMVPLIILLIAGLMMLGIYVSGSEVRGAAQPGTELTGKTCDACGGILPLESMPGHHCPHCGAEFVGSVDLVKSDDGAVLSSKRADTEQSREIPVKGSGFSKVFAVAATSMFFYTVVSGILTIAVILVTSDPNTINIHNPVFTNPAGLVDSEEFKVLYTLLTHLDLLVWYTIFLMGLGLSRIASKCSVIKGMVLIGAWYVLYALIHTGFSMIF